jgi:hypothetical protein
MVRRVTLSLLPVLWIVGFAPTGLAAEPTGGPSVALQADSVQDHKAKHAARVARETASRMRFRGLSLARGAIAAVGFGIFGWGVWLRRRGRPEKWQSVRVGLLSMLAAVAFAGYYNFFAGTHVGGFQGSDVFHYYVGSKYFAELGYFELYPCTLAALVEDGIQDPTELPEVRNQHTLRLQSRETTRAGIRDCPERFSPERWSAFKRDLRFFRQRILGNSWRHLLMDHGYNPTPVWSFLGGLLSQRVPADSQAFPRLIQLDRVLAVLMATLLAWAFGVEVACLAALAWCASPLWSYNWIGDAFLRNLWLFGLVFGLCLLERGRQLSSGVLLAAVSLLRLFPGVAVVGLFARQLRGFREFGIPASTKRFALGLGVGGLLLLTAGAFGTGRGPGAFLDFREKMAGVVEQPGINKVGLSAFVGDLVYRATTQDVVTPSGETVRLPKPAPVLVATLRMVQGLLVLLGLVAFWRALPRTTDAEAAMLAFALVPLLTSPASYYYSFVIVAAMLARRRPWAGVVLSLTVLAWIGAAQIWFLDDLRYRVYDLIAVAFSLALLVGAAISPPLRLAGEPAPSAA